MTYEHTGRFAPFHHLYQMVIELIHNCTLQNKNVRHKHYLPYKS